MNKLNSNQRKQLRAIAHHLEPAVMIGKGGVNKGSINIINNTLKSKELIKIKFRDFKDEKEKLSNEIEKLTHSSIVGIIGHTLILYKENNELKKNKLKIK
jgi:RNA-binding protein